MSDTEQEGDEQAQATGTSTTQAHAKTGFSKGAKALIGGLGLGAALYLATRSFKRFVWPEKGKLKRGAQILLMGGTFYWATHCGSVNAKIGQFYTGHVKPTVVEWKTGQEKISSLEQKAQTLEQSKIASDTNYQKTQEALKQESEKTKKLEIDYKLEKEKSKGLASTLKENEARLGEKDNYISKLEVQVREGMKQVDEADNANMAVVNYASDPNIIASGYQMPSTLSRLESKLAEHLSYIIYVDKDENKLNLYQSNNGKLDLVKRYNCSTGLNPAKKMREGDKATPEGMFLAEFRNFAPGLEPLYGAGVVGLMGQGYKGIVICGADYTDRIEAIEQGRNITNGGVIMKNQDLIDLDSRVGNDFGDVGILIEHSARPLSLRINN